VSVSGGISGRADSQESLSKAAAHGAWRSSSTPGIVGKAIKQRVGQSESRAAGAPSTSSGRKACASAFSGWMRHFVATATVFVVLLNHNTNEKDGVMRRIIISAAASVDVGVPDASLQVALHVTMRQNGAKASNRVSVSGGISGRADSQESLSKAAAHGAFVSLVRGARYQRCS
jgi:hypothetical protein